MTKEELPFCECGCGLRVTKPGNRFINGHSMRGVPHTPEHIAAISQGMKNSDAVKAKADAQRGVPRPPETCAKISATSRNSDAVKAASEKKRGGNDIVNHHYIYDHSDLSLNTAQMTRSDHTSLHNLLQKLGYKVPHINIEVNENE
jgi:hypothetical protein